MAGSTPQPEQHDSIYFPSTLSDRVRGRVAEAGRTLEGKTIKRPRKPTLSSLPDDHPSDKLETSSLLKVYRELRSTYRQHRASTGQAADPALREAVVAFKRGPSLVSLTSVASFLEERKLLSW
jgi:hypothetical protein